jgi:hypothetical protein
MPNDVVVSQDNVSVVNQDAVLVEQVDNANVTLLEPQVQLTSEEFVISSGGMYGGNGLIGQVPEWLMSAVQQELTTGTGNITSVVIGMQSLLDTLQTGVTQAISSLNTLSSSTSSITTGLQSQVTDNKAELLNVLATKVTSTEAQAIVANGISSAFGGNIDAHIGNIASTYVDANSAIAQEVGLLQANLNNVSASVSDISTATVEYVLNTLWVDDGSQLDPDVNGQPRYVLQAKAKKQLQVDANGVITGIILDSGTIAEATIQADVFKLVATGQSVASRNPFTVNATTGEITLNGKVSFNSVTDVPQLGSTPQQVVDAVNAGGTTTINGSHITTGTIAADKINTTSLSAISANLGTVTAGIIYDSSWDGTTYKMKIDLNNGGIYIR